MATTIGGLSTMTTSNIRGYGGLASGLDRDSLIEGMTYATTSKITRQQQQKQLLEWKQSAIQSISNLMVTFANKYTSSWSSKTNLFSSALWGRNKITTTGTNSKYVSVSGTATTSDPVTVMGVKQLAQKAKWTSSQSVSKKQLLNTGAINTGKEQISQELLGKTLTFKYGGSSYTVFLHGDDKDGNDLDYSTAEAAAKSINTLLGEEKVGDKTLADFIKLDVDKEGKFVFSKGEDTNARYVTGGTALELMGFEKPGEGGFELTGSTSMTASQKAERDGGITRKISFAEQIAGKSLSFTYNGVTKSVKIGDQASLMNGIAASDIDGDGNPISDTGREQLLKNLKTSLQNGLNDAFGTGRIEVTLNAADKTKDGKYQGSLSFETKNVTTGSKDTTSTLTLNSGADGLLGANGALNVNKGATNKLNLNAALKDYMSDEDLTKAGFTTETVKDKDGQVVKNEDGTDKVRQKATIKINEASIDIYADESMADIMKKINADEDAKVTVSYQAATDKFTFTSKENGASGKIKIEGEAARLFGAVGTGTDGTGPLETIDETGKDAIVRVKYDGMEEGIDLYRDTNTFNVNGLSITVKDKFGYDDKADVWMKGEEVEITSSVNSDSIVDAVKSMVEEYNAIIELANKEVSTKPDRDYAPLTSEQKKEMSEDDIKLWEEKAKQGLLFGDSDLRGLTSDLRFVASGAFGEKLRNIGITTSSSYSDNGKLSLDEAKLRAALESDPDAVEKAFTDSQNGLATNLKKVMSKYAETTGSWESKGVLIRKAGIESSPMSVTENYLYKQIAEINKQITKLQTQLEAERDRYIQQFTSLESLISQMNSQSSYLSQIGGY